MNQIFKNLEQFYSANPARHACMKLWSKPGATG